MNTQQTQALTAALKAPVIALANEIRAHELAQAARHFANIGLGQCDCEDCTKRYKYPVAWYHLSRKVLQMV